jgi:DNA-directed RNA polymerase subunit N
MIPVRCLSCGKVVSAYFEDFQKRTEMGENPKEVLDDLGITRYCCPRMFIAPLEVWQGP